MAGDWYAMRLDLDEDPSVIQMAAALGLDELDVVGRIHRTWAWFNKHTEDGHAPGMTAAWLDRHTRTPGWSEAMADAGWLEISEAGLTIPSYGKWNSKSAKNRLKERDKKRQQRDERPEKLPTTSAKCPTSSGTQTGTQAGTQPGTNAGQVRDQNRTREEKSTEEKSTSKTDHIRTSWKDKDYQLQVRGIAAESFRGVPFLDPAAYREDDRKDLLGIAAIHHSGQIRPQWFLSSLDAIHNRTDQKPVTAPVRLFKRILADRWPQEAEKRFGAFYKALYAVCKDIPPDMLKQRQPAGQEAGATP